MQSVFNVAPGGSLPRQGLGFAAAAVVVDNYTPNYIVITDAGKTIPPWVYGAVVALPDGTTTAAASLKATTPAIPGPPVPVSQVTLTWTDQALPASAGHLLAQASYSNQQVIATVSAPAGQARNQDVPVPAGTQSIGYLVRTAGGNVVPAVVTIVGDQSGNEYAGATSPPATGGPQWASFALTDTTVLVDVTAAGGPAQVDILASPLALSVDAAQSAGTANAVFLTDNAAVPLFLDDLNTNKSLGVSLAQANPAPWQEPNLRPIRFVHTFPTTQAGALEIIAGVAGQAIRIWQLSLVWDATAAASSLHLVDAAHGNPAGGTIVGDVSMVVSTPPPLGPGGPLTVGNSLYAWADSGTPSSRGWLSASQG